MVFRAELQIENDVTALARDLLAQAPRRVQRAITKVTRTIEQRALEQVQQIPGPPKYPIRWKSERQRRAFFATKGFGKGIPYQRTGKLVSSWTWVSRRTNEGIVKSLVNPTDYARFVQGNDAQPFHLDTGWTQAAPVFVNAEAMIEDAMITVLIELDDELNG